jgi:two-component system, chemotaxis family, chemotaxis protein CheY
MAKTVLIADDSATVIMSVKQSLEMAGFTVVAVKDGAQALAHLDGGLKPDLIITDINMPVMGGMELIRKVRERPKYRFTPILTLTTESGAEIRGEAKKIGATGWIVKPVAGAELVKIVKQVVPGA